MAARRYRSAWFDQKNMKVTSPLVLFTIALAVSPARADDKWDIAKLDLSKLPPIADKQGAIYDTEIRPLFEASCVRCHGEEKQKGGLRLDSLDATLRGGKAGKVVAAGDSLKSLLVAAAAQVNNDVAMPPKHAPGGPGGTRPPSGSGGGGQPHDGHGGPGWSGRIRSPTQSFYNRADRVDSRMD
jgi:hypothetical protein